MNKNFNMRSEYDHPHKYYSDTSIYLNNTQKRHQGSHKITKKISFKSKSDKKKNYEGAELMASTFNVPRLWIK